MTVNTGRDFLSASEIRHWAEQLNDLSPAHLQEIRLFGETKLAVGLYRKSLIWLVIDLNLESPRLLLSDDWREFGLRETKKPLSLFMAAHFRGAILERAEVREGFGRVLWLKFSKGELELRL